MGIVLQKGSNKTMREILFKNLTSVKNRRRVIAVSEKAENKDYFTRTHKIFIYVVQRETDVNEELPAPVFQILKFFETKTRREKFAFRVKGFLYLLKGQQVLKVHFCHSLKIDIVPKKKISPAYPS